MTDLESLRYPVGRFARVTGALDRATRSAHIDTIEQMPARFRSLVAGKSDAELDAPYRPGGWTVRQVVHHVPDSHMNAYLRMKFAMTEDAPAIKVLATTASAQTAKPWAADATEKKRSRLYQHAVIVLLFRSRRETRRWPLSCRAARAS